MAHKNAADLFDDTLPKYSDIKHKFESSNLQQPSGDIYLDYFSRANEDRYIKSELIVNEELSTRSNPLVGSYYIGEVELISVF